MEEHEVDQAVNAAFDMLNARSDLSSALALFIEAGLRTQAFTQKILKEHGSENHLSKFYELLENELSWAMSLREVILADDRSTEKVLQ